MSFFPSSLQMNVLSRQVTAVSQELHEMTRLLKPLFHNPAVLLTQSALTPPPSVSSHSCSPALPLLTQHAPVDCSSDQNPQSIRVPEPSSPQLCIQVLQGEFDPLQSSSSQTIISHNHPVLHQTDTAPLVSHCSAPPSLNSSPHEHTIMSHPYSSPSIPSLSSSNHPLCVTPILVDLSEPSSAPQTQSHTLLPHQSQSESQLHLLPECHLTSWSHPHSLSQPHLQPLLQPPGTASHPREPLLNLQEVEWGQHTTQLSFIDEGQQSV